LTPPRSRWSAPLLAGLPALPLLGVAWTTRPRQAWDLHTLLFLNHLHVLPASAWSALTVMGLGLSVFIVLALFAQRQPHWPLAFLVCLVLAGGLTHAVKRALDAPRPAAVLPPGQLVIIGQTLKTHSMPSGHTVSAFAFAALVILSLRRSAPHAVHAPAAARGALAAAAMAAAILVAWSRIAVGAHWPSDVLVGAGLGWCSGAVSLALAERWTASARLASRAWWLVLAAVQIVAGAAMMRIDTGYPLAQWLQWALGAVSVASGLWHARLYRTHSWHASGTCAPSPTRTPRDE
jgi:membrane-associated phospholipid phosphatase